MPLPSGCQSRSSIIRLKKIANFNIHDCFFGRVSLMFFHCECQYHLQFDSFVLQATSLKVAPCYSCYYNSSLFLISTASRGKNLSKHVGPLFCHGFLNTSKNTVAVWTSDGRVEGIVACSALIPHGNTRLMWIHPISLVWLPASVRCMAWGDLWQQKKAFCQLPWFHSTSLQPC